MVSTYASARKGHKAALWIKAGIWHYQPWYQPTFFLGGGGLQYFANHVFYTFESHMNKLFISQAHFSFKCGWVSMLFCSYFHPILVDLDVIFYVCMVGSMATISDNNLANRHSLSLFNVLLLFPFLQKKKKAGKNWNLFNMSLAIIGGAAVKKAWFTRLITIMHCGISSRQL